ncbi:MAG TPA: hypothetical protein VNU94_05515 [Acidobacteriaceae bacterium]|jgi:hypothetical protein|nr:hypothetical protein [Acidobacteriaceae bacterium]
MILALALLLPYSDADTAMSIRHLELSYAAVLIIQFGYAGYVMWQRWKLRSSSNERPR